MLFAFRRRPRTGAASSAAALAGALAFCSPAAADELAVKNSSDIPVKVVVKNGSTDVGHADIYKRSSGKITLTPGVSLAKITPTVEATPIGANTHCSASKSGSSQYEVKCDAVASAPATPSGAGSPATTSAKPTTRNLEIVNDLKDDVTVFLDFLKDGKSVGSDHDIRSGASAAFAVPVDEQSIAFSVSRHLDMERVSCGSQIRLLIPASQQKMFVTPVDDKTPPPDSIKRADSRPCTVSPTSRTEKASPKSSTTPPVAGGGTSPTTKFMVENDLKDPIQILTAGGMIETQIIQPKQTVTFDHPVPHPDGKGDTAVFVYISRSHEMRLFLCGNRLQYVIPPVPEIKFFATRVAGAEWPPKVKPGEKDGGDAGGGKDGLPPPPSCELTRSQNFEK